MIVNGYNSCKVADTAIIKAGARVGFRNTFCDYCVIHEDAIIGNDNYFASHSVIGSAPEHRDAIENNYKHQYKFLDVIIGDNNRINEFVTINAGAFRHTRVGDSNFILRGAHIGHDTIIGNDNTISCNALIGGHSEIENNCNLGLNSVLHQFSYMGEGAMLGMSAVVTKKKMLLPYNIYVGNPARQLKYNDYLIRKLEIDAITLNILIENYIDRYNLLNRDKDIK